MCADWAAFLSRWPRDSGCIQSRIVQAVELVLHSNPVWRGELDWVEIHLDMARSGRQKQPFSGSVFLFLIAGVMALPLAAQTAREASEQRVLSAFQRSAGETCGGPAFGRTTHLRRCSHSASVR